MQSSRIKQQQRTLKLGSKVTDSINVDALKKKMDENGGYKSQQKNITYDCKKCEYRHEKNKCPGKHITNAKSLTTLRIAVKRLMKHKMLMKSNHFKSVIFMWMHYKTK